MSRKKKKIAFYKNSKLILIGEEGKKEIITRRVNGESYQLIANYLNRRYKEELIEAKQKKYTPLNIYGFFKRAGTTVEKLKKYKFDTLKKSFNTNGNVKQLMATLNGWLNEYKDAGEKLPLKQTVGYLIKLYELRVKIDQIEKESNQSNNQNMVKEFITKIQDEFSSNPKVTKEVEIEYNKEGVITSKKAKLTTNLDGEEDIITEEEELEMEDAELEKEQLKIEVRK